MDRALSPVPTSTSSARVATTPRSAISPARQPCGEPTAEVRRRTRRFGRRGRADARRRRDGHPARRATAAATTPAITVTSVVCRPMTVGGYQHHDGGEDRLPAEVPQSVCGILPEAFEPWPDPHAARSLRARASCCRPRRLAASSAFTRGTPFRSRSRCAIARWNSISSARSRSNCRCRMTHRHDGAVVSHADL